MGSRLQDVILRGLRAAQPAPDDLSAGTLYYVTDEQKTERVSDDRTTWESYSDASSSAVAAHASTHNSGGTDSVTITNLAGFPGGTINFLRADGTFSAPSAGAPLAHATTHQSGGSDQIKLDDLAATDDNTDLNSSAAKHGLLPKLSGVTTEFLNGTGAWATPASGITIRRQVTLIIDGGGSAITTGFKGIISLPMAGTWKKWRILSIDSATTSGSIVIDVWKDTYINYPPAVADTITGSAKPTLSSANKAESSVLTGWNTAFSAGDILGFNVDSITAVTKISLALEFE